ncbi:MAG: Tm-1-like ATP-binding domain-containing protein [Desulfatiglandaceae bacterium]
MKNDVAIAVVGTFDSKGEEHLFLRECIKKRGIRTLTINVGTKAPSPFHANYDLFEEIQNEGGDGAEGRDKAIQGVLMRAQGLVRQLHKKGEICGIISAGGGTGTHIGTSIMHVLPLGVPKIMISTVASRDMSRIVGTKDITMIHSVVDLLGVNSISGKILDKAAAAICGMVQSEWEPTREKKRIALTFFGFITQAAEGIKQSLEEMGYEVIPFHANGTGGMAMEELASEGYFDAILDLGTHELADDLMGGYCGGIGPQRLEPVPGRNIPRLVVPGGLDCAVLEFTRDDIPSEFKERKIFFYDFRSAIRLNTGETQFLAGQLAGKLNLDTKNTKMLIPTLGWSEADRRDGPLYDPIISDAFIQRLKQDLNPQIQIREVELHINEPSFARLAAQTMDQMVQHRV